MTPRNKANELIVRIMTVNISLDRKPNISFHDAKECALITVNEIINSNPKDNPMTHDIDSTEYWFQVKEELEKI